MSTDNEDPEDFRDALPNITYYPGEHVFNVWETLGSNLQLLDSYHVSQVRKVDSVDPGKTFVLRAEASVGHILNDTIYSIVMYNKVFPDHKIILLVPFSNPGLYDPYDGARRSFIQNPSIWSFIAKIAKSRNINLEIIHFPGYQTAFVSVSDFYAIDSVPFGSLVHSNRLGLLELREATTAATEVSMDPPHKKFYISRSKTRPRESHSFHSSPDRVVQVNSRIKDDKRVFNEEHLEELFSDLGFEVVYVEELDTYEDQVKLFSEAKVIAGVTGAGLSNMTFMKPGTTVIEITTPIWAVGIVNIHNVYKNMATFLEQFYVSIPAVTERDGRYVAQSIFDSKPLQEYIRSI